jgi:hypothetical protein
MPNRLKLNLSFGGAEELTKGSGANGNLTRNGCLAVRRKI